MWMVHIVHIVFQLPNIFVRDKDSSARIQILINKDCCYNNKKAK
jgi:hypothetical protein